MILRRKQTLDIVLCIILFVGSVLSVLGNPNDINIWLHLISAKIVLQHGVIFKDFLSYTEYGNIWYPSQWLFHIILYSFSKLFGIGAIVYFTGFLAGFSTIGVYMIVRKCLHNPLWISFFLTVVWYIALYSFFVPRAQILAIVLFIWELFFLLHYRNTKKILFALLVLPIVWAWSNVHGSFFIGIYLSFVFAITLGIHSFLSHANKKEFFVLLSIGIGSIVLSVLPPLGLGQYQLLLLFYQHSAIIRTISEWMPMTISSFEFWPYTLSCIFSLVLLTLLYIKKRKHIPLEVLMLLPFLISPYLAERNTIYGVTTCLLISSEVISSITTNSRKQQIVVFSFIALFIILFSTNIPQALEEARIIHYPSGAVTFLQKEHIKGNMLNDDKYSDYLLYYLYPEYRVFIDGRFDIFLTKEIPDLEKLQNVPKNNSTVVYQHFVENLLKKYDISYVLLTRDSSYAGILAQILSADPQWSLVFWDDNAQIFLKRNGLNTNIINDFGTSYATPYAPTPFDLNHLPQALSEYKKMVQISDSAKTENSLGLIYLKMKMVSFAQTAFEKAIQLNDTFPPPYINLAEIKSASGDTQSAINLYKKLIQIDPTNVVAYINLGQLYVQGGNTIDAKNIWQQGIDTVTETKGRSILQQLINSTY